MLLSVLVVSICTAIHYLVAIRPATVDIEP